MFFMDYIHELEASFNSEWHHQWFLKYWWWSIVTAGVYIFLLFTGTKHMETRQKGYSLRYALAAWSALLGVFSILGTLATTKGLIDTISREGLHYSVCVRGNLFEGAVGFWSWAFIISKAFELVDTFFIVLRKQKLIFLHWFHHSIDLIYSWYCFRDLVSTIRYFATMNLFVHALMYPYYSIRASSLFRVPQPIRQFITFCQTFQMVIGVIINIYTFQQLASGNPCDTTYGNIAFSSFIYFSFGVLFINFAYHEYFLKDSKQKRH